MLGDIILAEPGALVGFAGPRVIEQTIGQKLPKGFQRSEFLLEHGFVDRIVEREEMKEVLSQILKLHEDSGKVAFEMNTQVDTGDMRIPSQKSRKAPDCLGPGAAFPQERPAGGQRLYPGSVYGVYRIPRRPLL